MQSPAMTIAMSQIFKLHAEAEANRLAKAAKHPKSPSKGRIAAALTSLRSLLSNPAERSMPLPEITDYPYRS